LDCLQRQLDSWLAVIQPDNRIEMAAANRHSQVPPSAHFADHCLNWRSGHGLLFTRLIQLGRAPPFQNSQAVTADGIHIRGKTGSEHDRGVGKRRLEDWRWTVYL